MIIKITGQGTFESNRQSVTDKSFIAIKNVRWDDAVTVRPWTDARIRRATLPYFLRIVSYWENDISLVVVTTPYRMIPMKREKIISIRRAFI